MKQLSPLRYILIKGTVTLIKRLLIHRHKSPSGVQAPKMCPGRGDSGEERQRPLVPASPGHSPAPLALAAPLGGRTLLSRGAEPPPAAPRWGWAHRVLVPCSAPCAVQRTQQRLGREQLPATPGEPKPQAAAKTSSAPRFCQRRLLFVASSVSPAASHYAFRMEGPCISLINKVQKTGPLRKS